MEERESELTENYGQEPVREKFRSCTSRETVASSEIFMTQVQNQVDAMREALTEVFVFVKERVPEIVKKKISFKRIKNILLELGTNNDLKSIELTVMELPQVVSNLFGVFQEEIQELQQQVAFSRAAESPKGDQNFILHQQLMAQVQEMRSEIVKMRGEVELVAKQKKFICDSVSKLYDKVQSVRRRQQGGSVGGGGGNSSKNGSANKFQEEEWVKNSRNENNSSKAEVDIEEVQELGVYITRMVRWVEKNEEQMKNFNAVKKQFIEDFERETEDLSAKWKELDAKKREQRQILEEEKEKLYTQIEEEMEKLRLEKIALKDERRHMHDEQEQFVISMEKMRYKESELKETLHKDKVQLSETKLNYETQISRLKQSLNKVETLLREGENTLDDVQRRTEDSLLQEKNLNEKISQLSVHRKELSEEVENLQGQRAQVEGDVREAQLQLQNIKLEIQKVMDRYSVEEQKYRENLESLSGNVQKKHDLLREAERTLNENEQKRLNFESLIQEHHMAKEDLKNSKHELLKNEHILNEQRVKIDENQLKIQMMDANLQNLKKHFDTVSLLQKEKQSKIIDLEQSGLKTQGQVQSLELKLEKLTVRYQLLSDDILKTERERAERKQEADALESKLPKLTQELAAKNSKLDKISEELRQRQEQIAQIKEDWSKEEKSLKRALAEGQRRFSQLNEELSQKERELQALVMRLEAYEQQEKQARARLEDIQHAIQDRESYEHKLYSNLQRTQREFEELSQKMVIKKSEEDDLQHRLLQMRAQQDDIESNARELDMYLREMKREEKECLERMKQVEQQEELAYLQQALRGDVITDRAQEKLKEIVESYHTMKEAVEQLQQLRRENHTLHTENDEYKSQLVIAASGQGSFPSATAAQRNQTALNTNRDSNLAASHNSANFESLLLSSEHKTHTRTEFKPQHDEDMLDDAPFNSARNPVQRSTLSDKPQY